jgi:hypothetical protein
MNQVTIGTVLYPRDFGLERLDEDDAIIGFAKEAEAWLSRWLDFAKGALLFLTVPDDPESGYFYLYDRGRNAFYVLGLPVEGHFGGFREDEFEQLTQAFDLVAFAKDPSQLRRPS